MILNRQNAIGKSVYAGFYYSTKGQIWSLNRDRPIQASTYNPSSIEHDGPKFLYTGGIGITIPIECTVPIIGSLTAYYRHDTATALNGDNGIFVTDSTDNTFFDIQGSAVLRVRVNGAVLQFGSLSGVDFSDGRPYWITVVYHNDNTTQNHYCYVNGKLAQTLSQATFNAPQVRTVMYIGHLTTLEFNATGVVNSVMFHDRKLSAAEVASLHNRPWQVFKPQLRLVPTYPYDPTKVVAVEAPAGDTLTITLVDVAGTPLTGLTGLSWAWFDESDVSLASTPTATGTGATTDGSGVFSVDITGTTLTTGQTGMLALMDSTGYTYALYKVTLT